MIYRPQRGAMWDPSVLWHDGRYHAFMMYNRDGDNGLDAQHCLLATSEDGVHWKDEAVVLQEREHEKGWNFFKCFVGKCGERFIMDHGVRRGSAQDMLRFYESTDLKNWSYLFNSTPDPRWYGVEGQNHRWDHMYILPKDDDNPAAGYWGYPVSVPKPGDPTGVGMMESADGREWTVLPPAPSEWPEGIPARDHFEYGGCERIGGRYYLIGGSGGNMGYTGYGMYTLVADDPRGPFRPDVAAHRLCGNSEAHVSWLAAWCRGKEELLISNYASMVPQDPSPWMLPLRKPIVDSDGHLRLAWWKGNEALKGKRLALGEQTVRLTNTGNPGSYDTRFLGGTFDPAEGVVIEGSIRAKSNAGCGTDSEDQPVAGFLLDMADNRCMAIMLGIGDPERRTARIGELQTGPDGIMTFKPMDITARNCATVNGLDDGKSHSFRLLSRLGMFELYVDDLLMQTFIYEAGPGKVGFVVHGADAVFDNLAFHAMSLPV